jgi:hypothetical protein
MGGLFGFWVGWRHGWRGVGSMVLIVTVAVLVLASFAPHSTVTVQSTPTSSSPFLAAGTTPQAACAAHGGVTPGQAEPDRMPAGGGVSCNDGSNWSVGP